MSCLAQARLYYAALCAEILFIFRTFGIKNNFLDVLRGLRYSHRYLFFDLVVKVALIGEEALFIFILFILPFNNSSFVLMSEILPHHLFHQEYVVLHYPQLAI